MYVEFGQNDILIIKDSGIITLTYGELERIKIGIKERKEIIME